MNKLKAHNRKTVLFLLSFCSLALALGFSGKNHQQVDSLKINLIWHKAYPTETFNNVKTGVLWSLSYLGAALPRGSFESAFTFYDSTRFNFNLSKIGFSKNAENALARICDSIKKTEDYTRNQAIDLSRFLVLTLYSPFNYYEITGVFKTYREFAKNYSLTEDPYLFGVTNSEVSKGNRLIKFSKNKPIWQTGFVAEEGKGILANGTFTTEGFETFDFMPNGQLRYAIYDKNGKLNDATSPELTASGKPGKCMWCHELYLQPLRTENISVPGLLSNEEFLQLTKQLQQNLDDARKPFNSDIDFTKRQAHTQSELLYISFMEPSLMRLKSEFKGHKKPLKKIERLSTHIYEEFPFLGNLYTRNKVDAFFSYPKMRIPFSVREKSEYEPVFFSNKK